jgi:hypothetical protein
MFLNLRDRTPKHLARITSSFSFKYWESFRFHSGRNYFREKIVGNINWNSKIDRAYIIRSSTQIRLASWLVIKPKRFVRILVLKSHNEPFQMKLKELSPKDCICSWYKNKTHGPAFRITSWKYYVIDCSVVKIRRAVSVSLFWDLMRRNMVASLASLLKDARYLVGGFQIPTALLL